MVRTSRKRIRRLGSSRKRRILSPGGTLAGLSERDVPESEESRSGIIAIPDEYTAEAIIYPVIVKGYLTYQSLADGSVDMKTFFRAKKLARFDEWLKDKSKKSNQKDEVEYFN